MRIDNHSLLQFDEPYLDSLAEQQVRALALELLLDLKEAREQLNQNSSNSSRPPGSEAPWVSDNEPEQDSDESQDLPSEQVDAEPNEEEESADLEGGSSGKEPPEEKRKAGRQKGSKGYGRTQELPITATVEHTAGRCAGCGREAPGGLVDQVAWTGYSTIDIETGEAASPGLVVANTQHLDYDLVCSCGHHTREEPYRAPKEELWEEVGLTHWRLVGPMLCAMILALTYRSRMSRQRVREFLLDWLGIQLSVGTLQRCIEESARAASRVEDQLVEAIVSSQLLKADETPHKERGHALWLWVFVCRSTVLYFIGSRSKEIVCNLLDEAFRGWLMSDGYACYRHFKLRLRCWAHLRRKARGLEESLDAQAQTFGIYTGELLDTLMEAVYEAREGVISDLEPAWRQILADFRAECERMKSCSHKKARRLAVEFLNDWEAIFNVLHHPNLPLTNNEAEQILRHWVILRRITHGTRSEIGSRAFALLASVIDTCRRREVSPWRFLAEVIAAARKGRPAPLLPET